MLVLQVLVNIKASGVNPSDTYVRLGPKGPWAATPHLIPPLPFTPGKDGAGIVAAIGEGVTTVQPGDRVYVFGPNSGTMAEYCLCKSTVVWPLPASMSFQEGACLGVPAATAYRALLQRGEAQSGDAVLIDGASGAVGLCAVQMAKAIGCFVVGTASTSAGKEAVLAAGADGTVNHRADGYLTQAKELLPDGTAGFDIVLEMAADRNLVPTLGETDG
eukprot:SAG31_NODE_3736_length_3944_cov_1.151120_6_plen_216_part_01